MFSRNPGPTKRQKDSLRQLSLAMELPFVLIAWVVAAGGAGYLLDRWLHMAPIFMLAGGMLGFAIGMWDLVKRLSREQQREKGDGGN